MYLKEQPSTKTERRKKRGGEEKKNDQIRKLVHQPLPFTKLYHKHRYKEKLLINLI